jgi:N-acyl-D-amino-acid deacylase
MHDLIIRGARVADGSGAPLVRQDVAVTGGRIAARGRLAEPARRTVDADDLVLAPGLVDVHTHYDAQLTWDPTASPSPSLGVTTVVIGNCGFGIAPCPPAMRDAVTRNLSEVEGMSLAALQAGIDWRFESFAQYLDCLRAKGPLPNVAAFVGHSTVRSAVMGPAASERAATADEIGGMKALVRAALDAGAIGFASSHSENHNGYGGVPMPSRLGDARELGALVGTLGETGRGLFQITVGPRNTVGELAALARATGRPVIFSALFHNDAFPERATTMLEECRAAGSAGAEVYAQVSCRPLSMDFTLANAYPMQSLEVWSALKTAAPATLAAAFRSGDFRARFRAQLAEPRRGKLFYGDWHRVEVAMAARDAHRALEGRTIAELSEARGVDPVDLFFDLALEEELATVYSAKLLNANEAAVEPLLSHPASVIALSDAGAHLTFLCDAGYGLHLLGRWVRERGAFTLEEAVRRLTSRPAEIYRLEARGRIAEGAAADLLLFDPATVACARPRRVHDLPGGESRLVCDPVGVHGVWVNGRHVFDGKDYLPEGRAAGEVLTRFSAR